MTTVTPAMPQNKADRLAWALSSEADDAAAYTDALHVEKESG